MGFVREIRGQAGIACKIGTICAICTPSKPLILNELQLGRGEILDGVVELKPVLLEEFTESSSELAAEDFTECFDGQEEAGRGIYPTGTIGSKAPSGNDVVYVGMLPAAKRQKAGSASALRPKEICW